MEIIIFFCTLLLVLTPFVVIGVALYIFLGNLYTGGKDEWMSHFNLNAIMRFITRLFGR